MKTLITFISQYDPIGVKFKHPIKKDETGREKTDNFRRALSIGDIHTYEHDGYQQEISDGPALVIIKDELPDKLIVIYSDEMKVKQENFTRAAKAVYRTKAVQIPEIQNEYVAEGIHEFEAMYKFVEKILDREDMSNGDYILNITSGTAQCQAAMYFINFIKDYHTRLARVDSPNGKKTNRSNQGAPYFEEVVLDDLLKKQTAECRDERKPEIETGEKLKNNLLQRTYKDFILNYEYKAALDILKANPDIISNKDDQEKSKKALENMISVFQKQKVLKELAADSKLKYNDTGEFQKVLNYYLMIDILNRRGQVTDVLVKAKSFAEFILKSVIERRHSDLELIKKNKRINIFDMIKILNHYHEYSKFETPISKIIAVNKQRNDVAHGLVVISVEQEELDELVKGLKELVITAYSDMNASLYQKYFDYYDIKNQDLISCLK
ncbi:hypothetical protein K1I76_09840 [Streptococcus sanguinis]|jgi:hypothetical protein|uniref:CRISPR-associated protein n=2 Tax=Streptococcus sanguinis TaxID=1305 RepID=F0IV59_STRSA|nr:hypothetical protein [Streptococcus sanguinis]PLA64946.1 hypothetical protein CYK23_03115 [Streptococcus salivarius]EGD38464.1 hypothetical protein HMPREF9384_1721 [Streptococcus sanguinis SK160]MBZ2026430.1 hypothetical protein [Streptococcus sanguinis]RSI00703.1 CRISPR-associated protein [Streptococcus sanguinis]RSI03199.1 CRISPR-associated protein [Streptococcus sanguinis]